MPEPEPFTFEAGDAGSVSALAIAPEGARAALVLAHGAGAGMRHPFLAAMAAGLAGRGIASLRYQFPFMERGSKRTDRPEAAAGTVRAAVSEARRLWPDLPCFAGGKSFGGRMTSGAEAATPLPGLRGLVFFGFPLHPPGKPAVDRAAHLDAVRLPMLFLQGTRDDFADLALFVPAVARLAPRATLHLVEDADHGFHVRARSGRGDAEVLAEILNTLAGWIDAVIASEAEPSR